MPKTSFLKVYLLVEFFISALQKNPQPIKKRCFIHSGFSSEYSVLSAFRASKCYTLASQIYAALEVKNNFLVVQL